MSAGSLQAELQLQRGGFHLNARLTAPTDGVIALFGPSGCGKTTLLRCLAGLEPGARGRIQLDGRTWLDSGRRLDIPPHRRSIGYVFQDARLFPHRSVEANLDYGYWRTPATRRRVRRAEVIDFLGLAPLLTRRVHGLSGGEAQRVALGRALLASPSLLLLDEPLAALDAPARAAILPYLRDLRTRFEIPSVYVSHQLDEVARIAGHMLFMRGGRIEAAGAVTELSARPGLPLVERDELGAVLDASVAEHDRDYGLTRLQLAGGELWVAGHDEPAGGRIRVRVLARDVAISREPPHASSVLNVLQARVVALTAETRAHVLLRLDVGGDALLARITRRSADNLDLARGANVYAQIKSVAIIG